MHPRPTSAPASVVVGTAGHIDHGKSTLVKALTGTDPDRLAEEKARGITIDLGFAFRRLPSGPLLMFVDVPGHERFVKNMLAGAGGIDAALLVVAADESVMPQTREHLDILRLLRIPRGIVAMTKSSLADAETRALVELEVRELVRGTFLEAAPLHAVDSVTGDGIEALVAALGELAANVPPRSGSQLFRMPVDRAFAMRGFGTVVTGTTAGGPLEVGQTVEILPGGRRSRVRGIEVAGQSVPEAGAGARTALNLPDLEVLDVERGNVVAHPGTLAPTRTLYASIEVLSSSPVPVETGMRLRLHLGAAEILARVNVLDGEAGQDAIPPGGSGLARLALEGEGVALWGDRFVLRRYSPVVTIAGGRVLLPGEPPRRLRGSARRELLERLSEGDPADAALALLANAGRGGLRPEGLTSMLGLPSELLVDRGVVRLDSGRLLSEPGLLSIEVELERLVADHHAASPLSAGISREALRSTAHLEPDVFRLLVERLKSRGRVLEDGELLRAEGFTPASAGAEEQELANVEAIYRDAGVEPPSREETFQQLKLSPARGEELVALLVRSGKLRKIAGGLVVHRATVDRIAGELRARLPDHGTVTVTEFKQLFGISRKYAIPLLEHLDGQRVTIRVGDVRRVLPSP